MKDVIRLLLLLFICISGAFSSQVADFYLKILLFVIDVLLLILLMITSAKKH